MQLPEPLDDEFGILVGVRLQVWSSWVEILDIKEPVGSHAADAFDGLVATVPCCVHVLTWAILWCEHILPLHVGRDGDAGSGEGDGCHVDVFDEVIAFFPDRDFWTPDHERDVGALVVEELFSSGVADAVVGHEDDECVVLDPFGIESIEDGADVMIRESDGIEVRVPVLDDNGVRWVVGRQSEGVRVEGGGEEFFRTAAQALGAIDFTEFAPMELDLHEERLAGFPGGPVGTVIEGRFPIEVVVGFSEGGSALFEG